MEKYGKLSLNYQQKPTLNSGSVWQTDIQIPYYQEYNMS